MIGLIQPNGLGISGNFLFICDEGLDKLAVFDISNPLSLVELPDYFVNINDPVDLIVNGNKMIVSTKTSFNFYDITDISNIKKLGTVIK